MRRRWLIALGAAFLFVLPVRAKDWQGAILPDQSTEFIFAYGSLINSASVVVEGALDYGETFAHELLETISDWSNFWLNDRELARRPWVYNPGFVAGRRAFDGEFRGGRETQVAPISRKLGDPLG